MALEAVVRHGSVTRAADELCVTHGAVSKHLAGLEQWLGIGLFCDNRHGMVPTEAAVTLAEGTASALSAIRASVAAVRPARSRGQKTETALEVIAPATFAMHWLIPRLPALQRSEIGLRMRVRPTHTPENWRELRWDLAIRSGAERYPANFTAVPLMRDRLGVLVAPALRRSLGSDDLRALTFLESVTRPGELDSLLAAAGLARADVAGVETFEHNYIALEAALAAQGAIVAPLSVVSGQIERGALVRMAPDLSVPGPLFTALFDPAGEHIQHAVSLIGWLRQQTTAAPALGMH